MSEVEKPTEQSETKTMEQFDEEVKKRIEDPNFDTKSLMLTANSALGKVLLTEAVKRHRKEHSDRLVKMIHDIMERVTIMQQIERKTQKRLKLLNDQLQAINNGEFEINMFGNLVFKQFELNIDWSATESW